MENDSAWPELLAAHGRVKSALHTAADHVPSSRPSSVPVTVVDVGLAHSENLFEIIDDVEDSSAQLVMGAVCHVHVVEQVWQVEKSDRLSSGHSSASEEPMPTGDAGHLEGLLGKVPEEPVPTGDAGRLGGHHGDDDDDDDDDDGPQELVDSSDDEDSVES